MTDQITNYTEADPVFAASGFLCFKCPQCGVEHAFVREDDDLCSCGLVFTTDLVTVHPTPIFRLWFNALQFVSVRGYVKEA